MKLKKNQSFTIVPKTKIINQVKKDQNENPLKSEDNGQHEFQGDEREKRGKKKMPTTENYATIDYMHCSKRKRKQRHFQ